MTSAEGHATVHIFRLSTKSSNSAEKRSFLQLRLPKSRLCLLPVFPENVTCCAYDGFKVLKGFLEVNALIFYLPHLASRTCCLEPGRLKFVETAQSYGKIRSWRGDLLCCTRMRETAEINFTPVSDPSDNTVDASNFFWLICSVWSFIYE